MADVESLPHSLSAAFRIGSEPFASRLFLPSFASFLIFLCALCVNAFELLLSNVAHNIAFLHSLYRQASMIPFSILDLSPIPKGASAAVALRNTLELAQHAESLGYKRYWLAEHHNMPGIASAATAIVIGHVAGGTKTIRVGSGGIMLPNHSPLVVAEQFGTLASLYPGRIDLGLGRAPGTDMLTARALRRDIAISADRFPEDVLELQHY